ncbi:hypothetical protein LPJ81_006302, partial [Coemansia sp. IMI 209127]
RLSATSNASATGSSAGDVSVPVASANKRGSTSSISSQSHQIVPTSADTLRTQNSFDVDERLVDNILEEDPNEAGGEQNNMEFFLKDEDSDGTNDDDDDETDSNSIDVPVVKKDTDDHSNAKKTSQAT